MSTIAVIPARWASSRFPGKPIYPIAGRPMIVRVCEQVAKASCIDRILVATDDDRIAAVCRDHDIEFIMTSVDHATGTDRLAEVAELVDADIYVNVQGDQPIISAETINAVAQRLREVKDGGIGVSTGYREIGTPPPSGKMSTVYLVPTVDGFALTLSRLPVPAPYAVECPRSIHVGLYAFTRDALRKFAARPRGPVEMAESIELLRYLEYGDRVAIVAVPPGSIGVNHIEDVAKVEAVLQTASFSA